MTVKNPVKKEKKRLKNVVFQGRFLDYELLCGADYNTGYTAENMALLRRISMNVVKTFDPQRGLADARRSAMYEPSYLMGLLSRLFARKC